MYQHMVPAKILHRTIVILIALYCTSCSVQPFQAKFKSSKNLYNSQFKKQLQQNKHEEKRFHGKNRLLWLFNQCSISQYAHEFSESNHYCQTAEQLAENLSTESVSENIHAYLTNSNAKSYAGETYERQLLHALGMINYAVLHNQSEALVESRKLDIATGTNLRRNISLEESLGRYLSALLYESEGHMDSALIDYRIAFHGYLQNHEKLGLAFPSIIGNDLLRAFSLMDMHNEYESYKSKYFLAEPIYPMDEDHGEVVIIIGAGFAPYRVTEYYADDNELLPLGVYHKRSPLVHRAFASVSNKKDRQIATKVYDASLTIKQLQNSEITRMVESEELGFIANSDFEKYGGEFSDFDPIISEELADVRSWSTLPGAIQLLRLSLPVGKQNIAVKYYSYYGEAVYKQMIQNVLVKQNKRTFVYVKVP